MRMLSRPASVAKEWSSLSKTGDWLFGEMPMARVLLRFVRSRLAEALGV